MAEKVDKRKENSGKKKDQKMKPFLVYDYLMRESDNEHFLTTDDIKDYLFDDFGIVSERRSIYNDIHEINKVLLALQKGISIEEAEALISLINCLHKPKHVIGHFPL